MRSFRTNEELSADSFLIPHSKFPTARREETTTDSEQTPVILKTRPGSLRERWAASFRPPQELWRLEYDPDLDLALYVSKTRVIQDRWNPKHNTEDPFGRAPVYHVWRGDDWLYCGPDMRAAYDKYNEQAIGNRQ